MKSKMNTERVTQLLASYGSHSEHWPETERDAALELIQQSSGLKSQWLQAQQLDQAMGILPIQAQNSVAEAEHGELLSRIMDNLPPQDKPRVQSARTESTVTNLETGKKPWHSSLVFKGMMAASLALIVTALITFNPETSTTGNTELAQNSLDQWFWEEITVDANQHSETAIDLMAMIDLEQLEDFQ
ncbi:MAG: hypothetical protein OEZ68_14145 [Gammaproteobacteria bacterium]|nr:hypothetical protein [Gammaproteobacteria bacterium]MDH5801944.1 hypothetical protein [Gammaproteobacteria bacterium]